MCIKDANSVIKLKEPLKIGDLIEIRHGTRSTNINYPNLFIVWKTNREEGAFLMDFGTYNSDVNNMWGYTIQIDSPQELKILNRSGSDIGITQIWRIGR